MWDPCQKEKRLCLSFDKSLFGRVGLPSDAPPVTLQCNLAVEITKQEINKSTTVLQGGQNQWSRVMCRISGRGRHMSLHQFDLIG